MIDILFDTTVPGNDFGGVDVNFMPYQHVGTFMKQDQEVGCGGSG